MKKNPLKILILEDSRDQAANYRDILRAEGYSVESFQDPKEALNFLSGVHFDAHIVDVSLPGMDGIAFVKESGLASESVIFVSAYKDLRREAEIDFPKSCILIKDVSRKQLIAAVSKVVRKD